MKNCVLFAVLALIAATPPGSQIWAAPASIVAGEVTDDRESDDTYGSGALRLNLDVVADGLTQARALRV